MLKSLAAFVVHYVNDAKVASCALRLGMEMLRLFLTSLHNPRNVSYKRCHMNLGHVYIIL